MDLKLGNVSRRTILAQLAPGAGLGAGLGVGLGAALAGIEARSGEVAREPAGSSIDGFDAREHFGAIGDGVSDDTSALQNAIDAGARQQRPIRLPPGTFKITNPLSLPSNAMLIGSSPGLGFGCRIEPHDCAAIVVGGRSPSFQCSVENLMIWPRGRAPDFVVSIDNSYSVTFRNIRIHEAQAGLRRAAVLLLGETASEGHGRCANIIWDNLVVRNDTSQPAIAVLAAKGCGSHRFIAPDLENFRILLEWQGGQIDLVAPYAERAGQYAVNCNVDAGDDTAYLNIFGGVIDAAKSGLGCAIRSTTRNLNSFGTMWGPTADISAYVYSLPDRPAYFHGIAPNLGKTGTGRFAGVDGWRQRVKFPQHMLSTAGKLDMEVPAQGRAATDIRVPGVLVGEYWARVAIGADPKGLQVSAFVSATDVATIVAYNPAATPQRLSGACQLECGLMT